MSYAGPLKIDNWQLTTYNDPAVILFTQKHIKLIGTMIEMSLRDPAFYAGTMTEMSLRDPAFFAGTKPFLTLL